MMKLRHGCHQRTPIWCWILLACCLAICLPGATLAWDEDQPKQADFIPDGAQSILPAPPLGKHDTPQPSVAKPIPPFRLSPDVIGVNQNLVRIDVKIATIPEKQVDKMFNGWSILQVESSAPTKEDTQPKLSGQIEGEFEIRGGSKTVIERNDPLKYALLSDEAIEKVLAKLSGNPSANTLSSPSVVVQEGNEATIDCGSQRPFVIGIKNGSPDVKIVSEGIAMQCRPSAAKAKAIQLRMDVALTTILAVTNSTFVDQGKQITLQIPEIQKTSINIELKIPEGKTLLLGGLRRQLNDKYESIIVVVKPQSYKNREQAKTVDLSDNDGDVSDTKQYQSMDTDLEPWDLTLDECLKIALQNSKIVGSLVQCRQLPTVESHGKKNDEKTVLVRRNKDVPLDQLEGAIHGLVSETAKSYWELFFFYANLNSAKESRDAALLTWRKCIRDQSVKADKVAVSQVQEQYFFFRGRGEEAKRDLLKAERQLRRLLGLAATDGRLIRPTDQPSRSKVSFDWKTILHETMSKSSEIKRQKWRIAQAEEASKASHDQLRPQLDTTELYQWLGLGDDQEIKKSKKGEWREWRTGFDVPIGKRAELTQLKSQALLLVRERAKLEDLKLELSHSLVDAVQNLEASYQLDKTAGRQVQSAKQHVAALETKLKNGGVTIDFLLDAQRRYADAQIAQFQSTIQHLFAILEVHFRKGSLLSEFGIEFDQVADDARLRRN